LPGRIATNRLQQLDEARAKRENKTFEEVSNANLATIPMRRYGSPQEYGDAAAFLASQQASYITGTLLRVDGGATSGH
jgi:3-oxoacyl-[acyl-carrier protein] reductase